MTEEEEDQIKINKRNYYNSLQCKNEYVRIDVCVDQYPKYIYIYIVMKMITHLST